MMLLTQAIKQSIPPLYSQEDVADPIVHVKFFTPWSNWTWYATEASAVLPNGDYVKLDDPRAAQAEDVIFFGLVDGHEKELGNFSLNELSKVRGPFGLKIERDRHFGNPPLSKVRKS